MRFSPANRRRRRRIVWSLVLLGIGASLGLALLEWGLLLLIPDLKSMIVKDEELSFRPKPYSRTMDYSTLLWDGRVNEYCIGALGERVPGSSSRRPQHPLVACYGDSNTFGLGVPYGQSYPARLEAHLGERITVMNFGVPAYNAWQSRMLAEEGIDRWSPDVLIFQVCQNDDDPELPVFQVYSSAHPPRSRAGWIVRGLWLAVTQKSPSSPTQSARDAVLALHELTNARGIPMILLRVGDPTSFKETTNAEGKIPWLPCPSFSADAAFEQYRQRSSHLNGVGNDIVAQHLTEMIRPILFPGKDPSME